VRLVIFLLSRFRWLLVSALVASAVNGYLASQVVALINRSLDAPRDALQALGIEFLLLSAAALSFRWFSLAQFVRLSQGSLACLRLHITRRIANSAYRDTETRGQGKLLAMLTEDVGTVGECFMILPWLFVHGVVLVGCLGHLLLLSWQAFSFMFATLLVGSLGYRQGARRAQQHLREARREEDVLFGHFRALFAGAKELKLHVGRRQTFLQRFLSASAERVRVSRTAGLLTHTGLANWRLFLLFSIVGGVLFWIGPSLGLSADVRSGYALTLLYMMLPVNAVLEAAPSLGRMQVALEQLEALGLEEPLGAHRPVDSLGALRSLRLSEVTHQYRKEDDERPFTLGPLSLELRPGELVFLIGGNGSGKTTLAKLITGLYEPESGLVHYNGRAIDAQSRPTYRECFSAVFSDFHLFEDLPSQDAQVDERARVVLDALQLAHKVTIQQGRLSTTSLSSGQRKRLALLVAWLEDRPVYVFDEWAADQDPVYKEVFYRQILPELKRRGKAVLVISHDDRYFALADRCLKLEDGRLLEHEEPREAERAPTRSLVGNLQAPTAWAAGES
jgi:putative ATP-binding cassette transporter